MTAPQNRAEVLALMAAAYMRSDAKTFEASMGAVLATLEAAGLRVVPVEMTDEPWADVARECHAEPYSLWMERAREAWPDLLAALPFAPPQGDKP